MNYLELEVDLERDSERMVWLEKDGITSLCIAKKTDGFQIGKLNAPPRRTYIKYEKEKNCINIHVTFVYRAENEDGMTFTIPLGDKKVEKALLGILNLPNGWGLDVFLFSNDQESAKSTTQTSILGELEAKSQFKQALKDADLL